MEAIRPIQEYKEARDAQIQANLIDMDLQIATHEYTERLVRTNAVKNHTWRGVPIIQYPGDLMVMQEIIWEVRPDIIIETGIAFGGMTKFYSDLQRSMGEEYRVLSIDINIRQHTRHVIMAEDLYNTDVIEGSSISLNVIEEVKSLCGIDDGVGRKVLVSLDSNHTHDHVFRELELYAPLVSVGSYIVVFDTAIEFFSYLDKNQDRPWGEGNNPWTAVQAFLKTDMGKNFVIDKEVEQRAGATAAIDGWLKRII